MDIALLIVHEDARPDQVAPCCQRSLLVGGHILAAARLPGQRNSAEKQVPDGYTAERA